LLFTNVFVFVWYVPIVFCSITSLNSKVAVTVFVKVLYLITVLFSIGLSNFCMVCGHGGHSDHMISWFETETVCPTGCGCSCMVETASMLES
jgi:hypothetical protein